MSSRRSDPPSPHPETPDAPASTPSLALDAPPDTTAESACVTATHAVLFAAEETEACDACGVRLAKRSADDDDEGYAIRGRGTYVWTRGADEVRREDVPLCEACAAAIGLSALTKWEIEEEEG